NGSGPASAPLSSPHLPFAGLQAQAPEAEERRSEGSSLYIHCPYTAQTGHQQKKAWCRMRGDKCEPLVETSGGPTTYPYTTEATKGKIKIVDNRNYETVSITMTNLQAEDSGTYSCAHRSNSNQYIPFRTISLIVSKGEYLLPFS
uniref:Ig-like domain-containing protein n=1 Tax=Calidris pygmaea TaxID=425635 RepID=A0A8C3PLH4_9CHAR